MTLDQNILVNVNSVKDLVLTVNDHLKFDVHINNTVAHAHRLSSHIHKFVVSKDPMTIILAMLSLCWNMHPGHHTILALSGRLNPYSSDLQSVYITAET